MKSRGKEHIKILHIDDEVNQLDFTKFFLEEIDEDVEVESHLDPEDALKKINESNSFDCIISDYKMLSMDGISLAEKVREKSTVPFILYTGQGSEEIAEKAFEAGIDDYLRKEIDPSHYQVLAKRVRHNVEKHRAEQLYRKVVEESQDGIIIAKDSNVLYTNRAFTELYGADSKDDILKLDLKDLIADQIVDTKNLLEKITSENDSSNIFKTNLRTRYGEIIPIEVSISKTTFKGEETYLCIIRDIDRRKKIEEEFNIIISKT